jgi:Divergent InlB B-repeat domain/FG-GAP-like repeat
MRFLISVFISFILLSTSVARAANMTPNVSVQSTPLSDLPGLGIGAFPQGYGNGTSGDFNGDGYMDVVFNTDQSDLNTAPSVLVPFAMYYFNPKSGSYDRATPTITGGDFSSVFIRQMLSEDINGDGITDFWADAANEYTTGQVGTKPFYGGNQYFYISNGPGSFVKTDMAVGNQCAHGIASLSSKDGIKRFAMSTAFSTTTLSDTYLFVSSYNKSLGSFSAKPYTGNDQFFTLPLGPYGNNPVSWPGYFYIAGADVNRDGNTDIIGFSSVSGANSVYLSDGQGGYTFSSRFDSGLPAGVDVVNVAVADFNGDKVDDMLIFANDYRQPVVSSDPSGGNQVKFYRVLIGNGIGGFSDQTNTWLDSGNQSYTTTSNKFYAEDINGDGYSDVVRIRSINSNPGYPSVLDVLTSTGKSFVVSTFDQSQLAVNGNPFINNLLIPIGKGRYLLSVGSATYNATLKISYDTPSTPTSPGTTTPPVVLPTYPAPNSLLSVLVRGANGTVTSNPIGLNCINNCAYAFTKGTTVTLTATPQTGSKLVKWGGACGGKKPTCRVRLTKNRAVTALFK